MTSKNFIIVLWALVFGTTLWACGSTTGPDCTANPADPMCQSACSGQTSCALQAKTCGTIPDGCGGTLTCGTCTNWLTCGGGGTANVCGASCGAGCPSGYSCTSSGVCTGGTPTGLVLDVKTVAVAGKVTLNGGVPTTTCGAASPASVLFQEVNLGYTLAIPVPCDPSFAFSGTLYPGTYKVTVAGNNFSNLPQSAAFLAKAALLITADQANLVLAVKTVNIDGKVTLNGAVPMSTCGGASPASVILQEPKQGYNLTIPVPCGTSFAFSASVYPGTYKVSVMGSTYTDLPQGSAFVVNPALILGADQTGLSLDVKTVTVSGKVTLNGALPTSTCASSSPASIILQDATQGYNLTIPVPCNAMYAWTGTVYPGTYKVLVAGNAYSNLPPGVAFVANPALVVKASQTGLAFDVKTVAIDGKVTLNGVPPVSTCTTVSPGNVVLQDVTQGYSFTIAIPCAPTFAWSGNIYPGTYKIAVAGNSSTNLPPGSSFIANPALVVSASQSGLVLDVKTVAIDGTVTLNGAPAVTTCTTTSPGFVTLRETTLGYNVNITMTCSATLAWSGTVFPGTYKVSVTGNTYVNLPQGAAFVANPALPVAAKLSGVALDVKTVALDGRITLNGAMAMVSCSTASPATVAFSELTLGYTLNVAVPCSPSLAFSGTVFPGTYRVAVTGNNYSNLPQGVPFIAIDRLQLP